MKKTTFKYYQLVLILIISGGIKTVQAQPKITTNQAGKLIEKTSLLTDRETYCVGEDILFSAYNISSAALRKADWSNVLYVELVSPDGESFSRRKFTYNTDGSIGALRIPAAVLTGNYYIRAYTRWMRDYSPYNYFYKMITVINPFRAELLEPSGNAKILQSEGRTVPTSTGQVHIKTNLQNYTQRQQVNLEVSVNQPAGKDSKFTVSVVPMGAEEALSPNLTGVKELKFSPDFIPETRGLSISGKVVNAADSVPLAYSLVGLTIFKENPENRNVRTNEKGQFFFDLSKLEGEYEIFISAKAKENQAPLILVDNDFSTRETNLPYLPVDFSDKSKELYQTISFNSQMQALYRQQKIEEKVKSFSSDSSFYGVPDFVLKLKDFIALPTVKDYFYELIPQVGVRHEGEKSVLKVLGTYSDLSIYDPLVLVDMVPIFDIDKVLALQPDKIDRIEVVTTPYVRGDIIFGGIVSLFSKKGDLAGIDLPSAGRFITYNMLSRNPEQPVYDLKNQRIPELRNCLYWNPDLKLKGTEPVKLSFDTGDSPGNYMIIVRGIDEAGNTNVSTAEIIVK